MKKVFYSTIIYVSIANVIDINMTPSSFYFKLGDGGTYAFDHCDKYTASF